MTRLEICIDNLESLFTAQAAGADRIELCSALGLGGLTPSYGFMQLAARHASVPVYAMIRPRAGDFCFSEGEFEMMLQVGESGAVLPPLRSFHCPDSDVVYGSPRPLSRLH